MQSLQPSRSLRRAAPVGVLLLVLIAGASTASAAFALTNDPPPASAVESSPAIVLNQLGFLPASRKLAMVQSNAARQFQVVRVEDGEVAYRGELEPARTWQPAARSASVADFSALSRPGRYRLQVAGVAPSDPFQIDASAYTALDIAALKAFYFNRAGIALSPELAGVYARKAGHADTEVEVHASAASSGRPTGSVISSPKGWYDAGDYNKYVVNSGISTYTLLAAYEHFPEYFARQSSAIPESGDAVPEILDEAWWNLEWMLSMQEPQDGGVYHKLTNKQFDGMVMPDQATERRYVVHKSTAAALDFAAVMAVASRVFAQFEEQFPGAPIRMRLAAESAWRWAQAHPDVIYQQPADVVTGDYGDSDLDDEFAWAAAELYLLTGEDQYRRAFHQHDTGPSVPGWPDVGGLAWISLAQHRNRLPAAEQEEVARRISTLADQLSADWQASPWRVSMQEADFEWGSNAMALNQAMMLIQGYRLSGKREYLDAAQSQLDYVLGRNPLGISFVTGHGLRTPMHIHHRPSLADGIEAPVPGFLVGGPNPGQQDIKGCPVPYPSQVPALSWLDHGCSYASNEIAINWNAPLVYVAAAIQALTAAAPE